MASSRGSYWPRDPTCISCTADGFFSTEPQGKLPWCTSELKMRPPGWILIQYDCWYYSGITVITCKLLHVIISNNCNKCNSYYSESVAQSCPTLCDPTDCSPPESSVHGVPQVRILEWAAISFSRGSTRPRSYYKDVITKRGNLDTEIDTHRGSTIS